MTTRSTERIGDAFNAFGGFDASDSLNPFDGLDAFESFDPFDPFDALNAFLEFVESEETIESEADVISLNKKRKSSLNGTFKRRCSFVWFIVLFQVFDGCI
jgi:hypothetical protein